MCVDTQCWCLHDKGWRGGCVSSPAVVYKSQIVLDHHHVCCMVYVRVTMYVMSGGGGGEEAEEDI